MGACTPGDNTPSPEVSQEAFQNILTAERDYILSNLEEIRDDVAASSVSRSQTDLMLDLIIPENYVPGGLKFNLVGDIETRGDVTDSKNQKVAINGTVNFDFESGALAESPESESITAEGSATGEVRFISNDAFGFLESKEFTSNNPEWSATAAELDDLIGTWYKLPQDALSQNGFNMTSSISPEQIVSDIYDTLSDLEIWELQQTLPASDGKYNYQVALNNANIQQNLTEVMMIIVQGSNQAISEEELEQMRTDISEFTNKFTLTGVLTVPMDNYDYFVFDGTITTQDQSVLPMPIKITNLETQKGFVINNTEDNETMTFAANKDDQGVWQMSLAGTKLGDDETQEPTVETFMTGSKSDDHFDVTIMDQGASIMVLTLDKDGDTWSGNVDFAGFALLNIEELIIDTQKLFRLKTNLSVANQQMMMMDITSTTENSPLGIDVIAPTDFIDLNEGGDAIELPSNVEEDINDNTQADAEAETEIDTGTTADTTADVQQETVTQ